MSKRLAVEDVHRVALDFYDAVADPSLLPEVVSRIIETWGAITCLTQIRPAKHDRTEVVATNFPSAGAEIYARYYWRVDPWAERQPQQKIQQLNRCGRIRATDQIE